MGKLFDLKCPKCGELAPKDYKGIIRCDKCGVMMVKEWGKMKDMDSTYVAHTLIWEKELDEKARDIVHDCDFETLDEFIAFVVRHYIKCGVMEQ